MKDCSKECPEIFHRKTNLEWLRIIAIFMIISYHYVVHTGFDFHEGDILSKTFLELVSYGGKAGVNIFCILMGYFGVKSRFRLEKVLRTEEQILFYSIVGIVVNILFNGLDFSLNALLKSIFPIIFDQYWFMTAYIIVYLLSPFINQLLLSMDRREYIKLLMVETIIWAIIPFFSLQESDGMGFTQLIWFGVMYSWGAYFRLYKRAYSISRYGVLIVLSILLVLGMVSELNYIGYNNEFIYTHTTYFRWSNSPIIIIFSLSLFRLFESVHIKNSKVINFIASGTLYICFMKTFLYNLLYGKKLFVDRNGMAQF